MTHKMSWSIGVVLAAAAAAATAACSSPGPQAPQAPEMAPTAVVPAPPADRPAAKAKAFDDLVDAYFDARFTWAPTFATAMGMHQHDAAIEDRSQGRIEARIDELKTFKKRLAELDHGSLRTDDAIDAQVIGGQIDGDLLDLETIKVWQTNPMGYAGQPGEAVDVLIKRNFAPAADRLRSVIARMKGIPALLAAARANVKNPAKEFTDLSIRMTKGSVGFFQGSVATWAKEAAGSDAALWAEFEQVNKATVAEISSFATWLEKDLLPRSKGSFAIGEATFLAKLKAEEMVDMPLADLLAKGQAQLDKDYAEFVATAKLIAPGKPPAAAMALLNKSHPTAADLIPSVQRSVEAARKFLVDKDIATVPSQIMPIIAETPPYARSGSFASMDTPGPYENKATEAFYYVTPVEKDWDKKHVEEHLRLYNQWVVALINIHEAFPGHYLQFLYAPKFPTKTRKLIFCNTNAEGWAHYTEQMMIDAGFGDGDPKYRLAQLSEALLRDVRYVNGIKLHTAGWTVQQGAKLFVDKGFQQPANAYEEARRGTYDALYLYYTLGKLEIQALRDEYRAKKNAPLREFHDAFVAQGGLPIPLVRQLMFR